MEFNRVWTEEATEAATHEPVLAFAIHDGHSLRTEVNDRIALSDQERLREEDPFTGRWTSAAGTRVIGIASRFQVDLNRPREKAVYRTPEDAWGLTVWKGDLPEDVYQRSLAEYDAFYNGMGKLLDVMKKRYQRFVILDIHSYNHRREGPDGPLADPAANPQVNVGTGTVNRPTFGSVIERFIRDLGAYDFPSGNLDVRENVKFQGGHFSRWVHQRYPDSGCVLAVEFKKFFMDEWTGEPNHEIVDAIGEALRSTVPGVIDALRRG